MARRYVKVEKLAEEVFRRKANGETNREIGAYADFMYYSIICNKFQKEEACLIISFGE